MPHGRVERGTDPSCITAGVGCGSPVAVNEEIIDFSYNNQDLALKAETPCVESELEPTVRNFDSPNANPVAVRNASRKRPSRTVRAKNGCNRQHKRSSREGCQSKVKNAMSRREQNRIAAAKCRAKRKSEDHELYEMVNHYRAENQFLVREIRGLKVQKTDLQNAMLAHVPGVCSCRVIHEYNFKQAQKIVLDAIAVSGCCRQFEQ